MLILSCCVCGTLQSQSKSHLEPGGRIAERTVGRKSRRNTREYFSIRRCSNYLCLDAMREPPGKLVVPSGNGTIAAEYLIVFPLIC